MFAGDTLLQERQLAARKELENLSIQRILCPVDFSEFSVRALQYAYRFARHFGARLYVQHTTEYPVMAGAEGTYPIAVTEELKKGFSRLHLELQHRLREAGVPLSEATLIINDGYASSSIRRTVSGKQIDLLVMGTHGRTGFQRLWLGSLAEQMIHEAVCPVLVVSHPQMELADPNNPERGRIRTILLATDFSSHSSRALAYALKWAREWGSKIVVFHAVEKVPAEKKGMTDLLPEYNPSFEKQIAAAWAKVGVMLPEAALQRVELAYEVRHGRPAEQILQVAEEKGADMIFMGARGSDAPMGPWGSVSGAVVRDGRFPVMVVRELN